MNTSRMNQINASLLFLLSIATQAFAGNQIIPLHKLSPNAATNRAAVSGARPALTGGKSLQQLVEIALVNNPEVSATVFDVQAAEARTKSAQGARLPRLTVEGGYTLYGDDLRLTAARYNGELGVFGNNILAADLVLRLPLYTGGKLIAEVQAADLLQTATAERLSRSKSDLVFNISSLYYSILAQVQLIESLRFSAEALDSQQKRANELVSARKAAKVDVLRIEVKRADIQQRLLREQNSFNVQKQALLNLLGTREPGSKFTLEGTLTSPVLENRNMEQLTAIALEHRPDAKAARSELGSQDARIAAARAGHWPTINLVGSVGQRIMFDPQQHPNGQDDSNTASRIGITIDIPLFEGGRINARISEERAKYLAQQQRLDKLYLQVRLDIETALANLDSARERLQSTEKVIDLARENVRIEQGKYALSRGTVLDVLDAVSALLDAQSNHIRGLADANIAAAQLAWATGENLP